MAETIGQESKEFFIDNDMILIEPLRDKSEILKLTIAEFQNMPGFHSYGQLNSKIGVKVKQLCKDNDSDAEVFKATRYGKSIPPIAFACYQPGEIDGSHEMAMLVRHSYLSTRLASELLGSLIVEAKTHGVNTLYTTGANINIHLRDLADKYQMSIQPDKNSSDHSIYSLNVDQHQGSIFS